MAKNKTKEVEEEVVVVEESKPVAKKVARDSATVTWRGGTRTYTRDVHGEDFEALAKEFAGKKGGIVA